MGSKFFDRVAGSDPGPQFNDVHSHQELANRPKERCPEVVLLLLPREGSSPDRQIHRPKSKKRKWDLLCMACMRSAAVWSSFFGVSIVRYGRGFSWPIDWSMFDVVCTHTMTLPPGIVTSDQENVRRRQQECPKKQEK